MHEGTGAGRLWASVASLPVCLRAMGEAFADRMLESWQAKRPSRNSDAREAREKTGRYLFYDSPDFHRCLSFVSSRSWCFTLDFSNTCGMLLIPDSCFPS
eukprot:TRINITY_DN97199_c0_g1_i1.p2 TRINITY_DN97199_c0_g1~~TRINITY_DN97199_c0_g1_i1.p2  ORF type:complete len:100 (+),score=2.46 TRINITY_DN97199_c0_g1_i1:94-393(+)